MWIKQLSLSDTVRFGLVACWLIITQNSLAASTQWQSPLLREHPLSGTIYDTAKQTHISHEQLIRQLQQARFILIGEKHDNPDHHRLEQRLLQRLQRGQATRLVLEMLNQEQVKDYHRLRTDSSDAEIRTTLLWPEQGWPWADYGPLIRLALMDGNQLRGGNIKRSLMMDIYHDKHPQTPRFSSSAMLPDTVRQQILEQVYSSHCQTIPRQQMAPMARIQINRDASMAWHLTEQLAEAQQSVLIAGAFHTRWDSGVPQHLNQADRSVTKVIMLMEVAEGLELATAYPAVTGKHADFVWFTPKVSDKDYCASLRSKAHQEN